MLCTSGFVPVVILLYMCPSIYTLKNDDVACQQFSICKCIFPTGRGVNLFPINQNLRAQIQSNSSISLHLCENTSFGKNDSFNQCFHNVSICYVDESKNLSLSLGQAENMTIISESQYQPMSIRFNNKDNVTKIDLICDEEAVDPILTFKSLDGSVYNLELRSINACVHLFAEGEGPPGGLSTGSVLVIMFLVFTLVYLGGGMLTLKLLRGAEGKEMIPNVEFWTDLPYLVRDGILFALSGFRPSATYDRI